ncbi:heparan-alpha-glucosaminide N-acetyltransferase domain-containing protein [Rhodococcus sp. NPDC127528]|uniref:heparan-alpha-glucosaminide N-acetyltransferase domain-containing protein n=1 Tax=unclassified Rhodococcus (in: high G+C Gram-positive bacteria) TaxID=192944 RepID=UPI003631571F
MTTPAPTTPATTPRSRRAVRLTGVDLARGLAVLGMIAVHSLLDATDDGEPTFMYRISAGHAAAMFAVLAGVAIAFLSGRGQVTRGPRATGITAALAARAAVIGLIGLTLGYTHVDYGVVILTYYAVMFLLAIPLIFLSTRTVAVVAVAVTGLAPVVSQLVRPHLPEVLARQISWETLLHKPFDTASQLLFTGEFPALVWMSYICVGIVVGRMDLRSVRTSTILAGVGAVLFVLAQAVSWTLLHPFEGLTHLMSLSDPDTVEELIAFGGDGWVPTDTWWWMSVATPHTGTALDLTATIGSSLLGLGLCLLLFQIRRPGLERVVRIMTSPLVAIGTMSLTVYVAHIAFINSDFDVYGPWEGYLRQLLVMAVAAVAWRATAGRGPLEGLVTSITSRVRRWAEARATARQRQS